MSHPLTTQKAKEKRLGKVLVGLGVFFVVSMIFGVGMMELMWPIFILLPGLFLFSLVKSIGKKAAPLAIPATMISTLALLLFYQNLTGHWESWAYAWSLLFPTALGLGVSVYGELAGKEKTIERGEKIAKVGLSIFAVGGIFFELLLNLSGWGFPLAMMLVLAGVYLMRRKKSHAPDFSSLREQAAGKLADEPRYVETPVFEPEYEKAWR